MTAVADKKPRLTTSAMIASTNTCARRTSSCLMTASSDRKISGGAEMTSALVASSAMSLRWVLATR